MMPSTESKYCFILHKQQLQNIVRQNEKTDNGGKSHKTKDNTERPVKMSIHGDQKKQQSTTLSCTATG